MVVQIILTLHFIWHRFSDIGCTLVLQIHASHWLRPLMCCRLSRAHVTSPIAPYALHCPSFLDSIISAIQNTLFSTNDMVTVTPIAHAIRIVARLLVYFLARLGFGSSPYAYRFARNIHHKRSILFPRACHSLCQGLLDLDGGIG